MKKSVDLLEVPELDYWFLRSIGWSEGEVYFDKKGTLLFYLNDDVNPPGMYIWERSKGDTDESFRVTIKKKFGEEVYGTPRQLMLFSMK